MSGYDVAAWHDFFLGTTGAAAALTGLVFVSLSINLAEIIATATVTARAGETILLLTEALIASALVLMPAGHVAIGVAVAAAALVGWGSVVRVQVSCRPKLHPDERPFFWARVGVTQVAAVPMVIGGVSLATRTGGGLYWLVAGVLCLFGVGIINAWVLLVEIIR